MWECYVSALAGSHVNSTDVLYIQRRFFSFNFHCLHKLLSWLFFMCLPARKSCCLMKCCNCSRDSCTSRFLVLPPCHWVILPFPHNLSYSNTPLVALPAQKTCYYLVRMATSVCGMSVLPSGLLLFIEGR